MDPENNTSSTSSDGVSSWLQTNGEEVPPAEPLALIPFNNSTISEIPAASADLYTLAVHGSPAVVAALLRGELSPDERPHRTLASAVHSNMVTLYATNQLPATSVGPTLTDQYLRHFVHPAIHHLLQLLGVHHQEISRHLGLFLEIHNSLQRLRDEASEFSREN